MLASLLLFVDELRRRGVPISSSELLDATAAIDAVGLTVVETTRDALRSCLVKNAQHIDVFDATFNLYFLFAVAPSVDAHLDDDELDVDLRELINNALDAGDEELLIEAVRQAIAQYAGMVPGRFFGVDYHARRVLRSLQGSDALSIARDVDIETSLASWEGVKKTEHLEAVVADEIRRQSLTVDSRRALADALPKRPDQIDFLRAQPQELIEMRKTVTTLGVKLASRLRRRRRATNRGRLNVGATIRHSLSTGGVPFVPVFRKPRRSRPRLVVLADVSASVASFARFTLQLTHVLSGQFNQVRTFVFVDEIDEVTHLLAGSRDFDDAMALINGSARVAGQVGHSDYGAILSSFGERWGSEVDADTTLLILGDARNNYHPVRPAALASLAGRARHVYWLNPEPRSYWDTADSVIGAYGEHCNAVFECRNVAMLARAVERVS